MNKKWLSIKIIAFCLVFSFITVFPPDQICAKFKGSVIAYFQVSLHLQSAISDIQGYSLKIDFNKCVTKKVGEKVSKKLHFILSRLARIRDFQKYYNISYI